MKIVIKTEKMIVALHGGQLFIFSIMALRGERAIPKEKNTRTNIGRPVVGFVIDDDVFQRHEIFGGNPYAKMVMSVDAELVEKDVLITTKYLNELEARNQRLCELEAAGVDNWEGF